jgi:hypothetical protein
MLKPNSEGKYFYSDLSKTWEEHWFSFVLDNLELNWDFVSYECIPMSNFPDTAEYQRDHPLFAGKKIPWSHTSSQDNKKWCVLPTNASSEDLVQIEIDKQNYERYQNLMLTHDLTGLLPEELSIFVPQDDYAILKWAIVNRNVIYNTLRYYVRLDDYDMILEFINTH